MTSRPRASIIALVSAAAMALAGCSHTQYVGATHTLNVALNEYRLNPESASVSAGVLTIVVRNYGRLEHNLVVAENGTPTGGIKPLYPGQATTLSLDLAPGTYSMYSTILDDEGLGTYGTLHVTP